MSTWLDLPKHSWRSIGPRSLAGFGPGEGDYGLSYTLDTDSESFLNGRVSANLQFPRESSVRAAGLLCRADSYSTFVALVVSSIPTDPSNYSLRLVAFRLGQVAGLATLSKPILLEGSAASLSLQFFSGDVTGEVRSGVNAAIIERKFPEVPFPGHCGALRLYDSPAIMTKINVERLKARPVLPEVAEQGDQEYEFDVFVSHSSADNDLVAQVTQRLRQAGVSYWVDGEQIRFGDPIVSSIESGLQRSKYVVVCASEQLKRSGWCRAEYGAILYREFSGDTSRRVIPLSLDGSKSIDAVPLLLSDRLRADFTDDQNFQSFLQFVKDSTNP